MGCLLAARLTEAGEDVVLFDKHPARASAITKQGLRIEGIGGCRTLRVPATAEPAKARGAAAVFLCVKAFDTETAAREVLRLKGEDSTVVSLQNGLGNAEQIGRVLPASSVVLGVTSHGATRLGPGRVRHAGEGPTFVGPRCADQAARARRIQALLTAGGIETRTVSDLAGAVWSKLVVNAAINALSAVANARNGALLEDAELRGLLHAAAREAAAVAKAKGIVLRYRDPIEEVEAVCRATAANVSSMLQDVRGKRRTEIEAINGGIVREARTLGIATPTNQMLLDRVRAVEKEYR